ncbi:efflux RND transporter periplasmic adaptor subunit [Alkalimarinus coralli]|uniref:efflux RND transporter periplasmic adaptor subunit n=1 Tax=Alkalimarinus coralli TaxID=2935863 RepID=UPI00202AD5F2|nr:efflux RND transporter periplasmic adaptor subunit [Alkalimarinus coralli]
MFSKKIFGVLLVFSFSLPAAQAEQQSSTSQPTAFLVETAEVNYSARGKNVDASGRLANKSEQKLSFKTSGPVAKILVDEGDRVKKGQLLAQLNQEEINAQVAQSQSVFDEAKRNNARYQALYEKGVVPVEQLQSAETRLEVARSNLRIAKFNKQHSVIVAPDDGRILKREIEANEMISPFQTAFVMSMNKGGWVIRSGVTDKDIVRINKGDQTTIQLDAYPGKLLKGHVSEVGAAADARSHLFEIEVTVDTTDLRLHSGFISRLLIEPSQQEPVALLPIEAIVEAKSEKAQVFVLNEAFEVIQKNVDIAWLESGSVAIKPGLEEGVSVVTSGATYLHEGAVVSVFGHH